MQEQIVQIEMALNTGLPLVSTRIEKALLLGAKQANINVKRKGTNTSSGRVYMFKKTGQKKYNLEDAIIVLTSHLVNEGKATLIKGNDGKYHAVGYSGDNNFNDTITYEDGTSLMQGHYIFAYGPFYSATNTTIAATKEFIDGRLIGGENSTVYITDESPNHVVVHYNFPNNAFTQSERGYLIIKTGEKIGEGQLICKKEFYPGDPTRGFHTFLDVKLPQTYNVSSCLFSPVRPVAGQVKEAFK